MKRIDPHSPNMDKWVTQKEEARTIRKIVFRIVAALIVILFAIGIGGYFYIQQSLKPVDAHDTQTQKIEIPIGSSASDIGQILENKEIIKSAMVFRYYVKFNNESGFQAGTYRLAPSMRMNKIVKTLKTGKVILDGKVKFTIPEGNQIQEIAEIIAGKTTYKKEEIIAKINSQSFIDKMMKKYPTLLTKEIERKGN